MNETYFTTKVQEKVIHGMLFTLAFLAVVYVSVLLSLVFSVIERKQNMIAVRELSSELSTLETSYASIVASITDEDLKNAQFSRVNDATFAVRKDDIASYTVLYAR